MNPGQTFDLLHAHPVNHCLQNRLQLHANKTWAGNPRPIRLLDHAVDLGDMGRTWAVRVNIVSKFRPKTDTGVGFDLRVAKGQM